MSSNDEQEPYKTGEGENLALARAIKAHPCLYNNTIDDYVNKHKVASAWNEISKELNSTVPQLKQRWKYLRSTFVRRKIIQCRRNIRPRGFDKHMNFLLPFTHSRTLLKQLNLLKDNESVTQINESSSFSDTNTNDDTKHSNISEPTNIDTTDDTSQQPAVKVQFVPQLPTLSQKLKQQLALLKKDQGKQVSEVSTLGDITVTTSDSVEQSISAAQDKPMGKTEIPVDKNTPVTKTVWTVQPTIFNLRPLLSNPLRPTAPVSSSFVSTPIVPINSNYVSSPIVPINSTYVPPITPINSTFFLAPTPSTGSKLPTYVLTPTAPNNSIQVSTPNNSTQVSTSTPLKYSFQVSSSTAPKNSIYVSTPMTPKNSVPISTPTAPKNSVHISTPTASKNSVHISTPTASKNSILKPTVSKKSPDISTPTRLENCTSASAVLESPGTSMMDFSSFTAPDNENARGHFMMSLFPEIFQMKESEFRVFKRKVLQVIDECKAVKSTERCRIVNFIESSKVIESTDGSEIVGSTDS